MQNTFYEGLLCVCLIYKPSVHDVCETMPIYVFKWEYVSINSTVT